MLQPREPLFPTYTRHRPTGQITHTSQACKRCHARKRKCDRKYPHCSACVAANVPCEMEIRAGDRALMLEMKDLRARNETHERRVRWLEETIAAADPQLAAISTLPTGQLLTIQPCAADAPELSRALNHAHILAAQSPSPSGTTSGLFQSVTTSFLKLSHRESSSGLQQPGLNTPGYRPFLSPLERSPTVKVSDLPPMESAVGTCKAFLSGHKQTHHLVDEEELVQDLHKIYQPDGLIDGRFCQNRFRCFMVLYLAQERYWTGVASNDPAANQQALEMYRRLALKDASMVLSKENLECVQALGLLALLGIQEPGIPDVWQAVGMAARTAVAMGIHRKDSVYLPSLANTFADEKSLKFHNERRKNIFWAIYSLDRLVTFTLSRPPALRDDDIDVELPSLPPHSSIITREVPGVALRIHSLHGRKLYGQIFESLYAVSVTSNRPIEEREAIINNYTRQVQEWYASSPLKAAFVPITEATVRRQSIADMQYHQMIMALHRSSPLMPRIPSSFVNVLHEAASISVDLYHHYSLRNQVLVNWIHLHQIFTSCTTLVYCFCEYQARHDLSELPRDQVVSRISQCKELLARFSRFGISTPQTQNYEAMFDLLAQSFSQQQPQQGEEGGEQEPERRLGQVSGQEPEPDPEPEQEQEHEQQPLYQRPEDPDIGASTSGFVQFSYGGDDALVAEGPMPDMPGSQAIDGGFEDFWTSASPSSIMRGFWPDTLISGSTWE